MGRVMIIASGKGGVGKTTIVANLGIALEELGHQVLLIDADVAMANLSLVLGLQNSPITLHEVLLGEAGIEDAVYEGPKGVELVPSGLSLESYRKVDTDRLKSVISHLKEKYDYILLDAPAGIEKNVQAALAAADELMLLMTPDSPSIADALKTKIVAQRLGTKTTGIVINFIRKQKGEIAPDEIMKMLELPSYGEIPYDEKVKLTFLKENAQPVVARDPKAPASKAIMKMALKIAGKVEVEKVEEKTGFLQKILGFLKRKK